MSDIHALSGAYAVDAVDDVERARFERHLADCADCRAEVDSLREAAAALAETTAVAPPASLRDRVLADIATVRPLPPVVEPPAGSTAERSAGHPTRPGSVAGSAPAAPGSSAGAAAQSTRGSRGRRWLPGLAAAAAVLAVVGVGAAVVQPWEDEESSQVASPAERVRNAPDAEVWKQEFPDGSAATLIRSESLNEAVVVTDDMADPAEGKVYELWLQHDDVMVPAGLMPPGPDNTVLLEGDPADADGFGITVEPEGGSEEPTSPPLAVIEFDQA